MKHFILLILIPLLTACSHHKSGYLNFDQGKIYYETYGKGEPIIVLHGGPGLSHDYFMPHMLALDQHHQVTFYDMRGSGKSTNTPYDKTHISQEQFVEDLDALRKSLGHDKVTLLGHSYGGLTTMQYAIKYPEHVKSMILADTTSATFRGNQEFAKEFRKRIATVKGSFDPTKEMNETEKHDVNVMNQYMRATFSVYYYNPDKLKEQKIDFTKDSVEGFWKTYTLMMENYETKQFDLLPQLAKLTIPTLIIHGDHDIVPLSVAKEIHTAMKSSELVIIKDCDHMPFIEKPKEFFEAIDEFVIWSNIK